MFRCFATFHLCLFLYRLPFFRDNGRDLRFFLGAPKSGRRVVTNFRHLRASTFVTQCPFRNGNVYGSGPLGTRIVRRRAKGCLAQGQEQRPLLQLCNERLRIPRRRSSRSNAGNFSREVGLCAIRANANGERRKRHLVEVRVHVPVPQGILTSEGRAAVLRPFKMNGGLIHRVRQAFARKANVSGQVLKVSVRVHCKDGVRLRPRFATLTNRLTPVFVGRYVILCTTRRRISQGIQDATGTRDRPPFAIGNGRRQGFYRPLHLVNRRRLILRRSTKGWRATCLVILRRLARRFLINLILLKNGHVSRRLSSTFFRDRALRSKVRPLPTPRIAIRRACGQEIIQQRQDGQRQTGLHFRGQAGAARCDSVNGRMCSLRSL